QLLMMTAGRNASDLHISAGLPPMVRIDGDLEPVDHPAVGQQEVLNMLHDIMGAYQRKDFEQRWETDFSYDVDDVARFRVNAFTHSRGVGAAFRTIPSEVWSLEDLKAP